MTNEERETVITFNQADNTANVYTCMQRVINAIEKRGIKPWQTHHDNEGNITSKQYTVPVEWIAIRPKRQVSEETKKQAAIRLQQARGNTS